VAEAGSRRIELPFHKGKSWHFPEQREFRLMMSRRKQQTCSHRGCTLEAPIERGLVLCGRASLAAECGRTRGNGAECHAPDLLGSEVALASFGYSTRRSGVRVPPGAPLISRFQALRQHLRDKFPGKMASDQEVASNPFTGLHLQVAPCLRRGSWLG